MSKDKKKEKQRMIKKIWNFFIKREIRKVSSCCEALPVYSSFIEKQICSECGKPLMNT